MNELIGKTVIVYDRYHFAKPIRGKIEDVSEMDGAYKVSLFGQQHGYPNYLSFDHKYFFSQQCQILEDVPEFVDLEIIEFEQDSGKWLGVLMGGNEIILPYQFTHLHCLPSLPNFEGFYGEDDLVKGGSVFVFAENIARQISEGKKVFARFRS